MVEGLRAFAEQSPIALLVLGFALAFAESGLGLGFLVPGETGIAVLGGIAPSGMQKGLLVAAVAVGALAGDHVGFLLGHRFGANLSRGRFVRRLGVKRWEAAAELLRRRGVAALLLSRLLPVVRTLMPAVAGTAGLAYVRFLAASVIGATAWAAFWVTAGSVANVVVAVGGWPTIAGGLATAFLFLLGRGLWRRRRAAAAVNDTAVELPAPTK